MIRTFLFLVALILVVQIQCTEIGDAILNERKHRGYVKSNERIIADAGRLEQTIKAEPDAGLEMENNSIDNNNILQSQSELLASIDLAEVATTVSLPQTQSKSIQDGSNVAPWYYFVLKVAGPLLFIALQVSSLQTAYQIYRNKSVGSLSPLPFISLLVNSAVWSLYGVLKMDSTVLYPNATGAGAGLIAVLVYHRFAKDKPVHLYTLGVLIVLLSIWFASSNMDNAIGLLGCSLSVALSASPLAVVRTVIREQSTAALPFGTSLVLWLNALSWLTYGYVVAHDAMIYGPNALGLLLSSVQMCLFVIYGFPQKEDYKVTEKV